MRIGIASIPLIFILIIFISSVFYVPAERSAVILRYGRISRIVDSGARLKIPLGIEKVILLPVDTLINYSTDQFNTISSDGLPYTARASFIFKITDPVLYSVNMESEEMIIHSIVKDAVIRSFWDFDSNSLNSGISLSLEKRILDIINDGIRINDLHIAVDDFVSLVKNRL